MATGNKDYPKSWFQFKRAIPFGSTIRETIKDIQTIRGNSEGKKRDPLYPL